jgi:hypothetical protein
LALDIQSNDEAIGHQYYFVKALTNCIQYWHSDSYPKILDYIKDILSDKVGKAYQADIQRLALKMIGPFIYYFPVGIKKAGTFKLEAFQLYQEHFEKHFIDYQEELAYIYPCMLNYSLNEQPLQT